MLINIVNKKSRCEVPRAQMSGMMYRISVLVQSIGIFHYQLPLKMLPLYLLYYKI